MSEESYREAMELPWERLLDLFGQMLDKFTTDGDGTAFLLPSDWEPTHILAYELMRRTEVPETVQTMMLRRLAMATMTLVAAIRYGADHLVDAVTEWAEARAELMTSDVGPFVAVEAAVVKEVPAWAPVLVPNDPLTDYVDVEGGYRWFYDGRPPEPVQE